MASTDSVPCYYTGQRVGVDPPAESRPRHEVREFKRQKLGKFVASGKFFLFFKRAIAKAKRLWDGPLGVGNALPFSPRTDPTKHFHYEVPPAGDVGLWRHFRKRIRVSARPQSHLAAQWIQSRTQLLAPARLADALPR